MRDLKTKDGIILAVKEIENDFISKLRQLGIKLSENAICKVSERNIELGIKNDDGYIKFASSIDLYAKNNSEFGGRENEINFGSSGSFTPKSEASYWRTIHAASILENWENVCSVINDSCKEHYLLREEIIKISDSK